MEHSDNRNQRDQESKHVVVVGFGVNVLITVASGVASVLSGSPSMLAQTVHAGADAFNHAILWVAGRNSRSHHDLDRIESGREAYFWALLAAIGLFVIGATVSIWEGARALLDQKATSAFTAAYVVLSVSLVLDGYSTFKAYRRTRTDAHRLDRDVVGQLKMDSDPTTRAVLGEEGASVVGDVVALVAIGLHQATGHPIYDAAGSIAIGLLLVGVAVFLARRNRDFLIGQNSTTRTSDWVRGVLLENGEIRCVNELLVTFVGPRQLWVVARIEISEGASAAAVESLTRSTEKRLRDLAPFIIRVDLIPHST